MMKLHYNGMTIEGTPEECAAFARAMERRAEGRLEPVQIPPYQPLPWETWGVPLDHQAILQEQHRKAKSRPLEEWERVYV